MASNNVIIRFENVSFAYTEDKPILDEANFSVRENSKITIMGQNGAGKSTLINLMAGLLKPGQDANSHLATYLQNLKWAAAAAAQHGLTLVIEPINLRDMPALATRSVGTPWIMNHAA